MRPLRSALLPFGFALLTSALGLVLALTLAAGGEETPFMPLLLAVAITALYGGLGPGLLACALTGVSSIYLVLGPDVASIAERPLIALQEVEFGLLAVLITVLIARLRAARQRSDAAQRRLTFLAEASQKLAGSLDLEATLRSVTQLIVPHLADWCTINFLQADGRIQPVAVTHRDPSKLEVLKLLTKHHPAQAGGPHPLAEVLRSREPMLVPEITEEWLIAHSRNEEHRQLHRLLENRSYMCVPLIARERLIGTISFFSAQPGRYGPLDLSLAEDLARRIAVAVDNAHLYREAQQALRARDEFLSNAAHELRTPLAGILAHAELLGSERREPDEMRSLEAIERQCLRLKRLVEELLEVSRLELSRLELHRRRFELGDLAAELLSELQVTSPGHRLVLRREAAAWVEGDGYRIEQVLLNLVGNAVKFSPGGGEVTIRVSVRDGNAVVAVEDQGLGIPADRQERLFERFYRAHEGTPHDFGGLGLGLFISHEFVRRHGGQLWVESVEGRGSTFSFSLPLAGEPQSGAARPLGQEPAGVGG